MAFNPWKLAKYQAGMRQRIVSLLKKTEISLDFAMDHMMLDRMDSYFKVEEGLSEIDIALNQIHEEVEHIRDVSAATRLESRLEFVEDRWEELDSEVRERPKRRRKKINLSDFFKAAGGGGESSQSSSKGEITNSVDAYLALGLEYGSSMTQVTRAFRLRAKELHPDVREGDRTAEPELRRIIEAYQFLKENINYIQSEPPPTS